MSPTDTTGALNRVRAVRSHMHPLDTDRVDDDDVLVAFVLTALSFVAFVAVLLAGWGRDFVTRDDAAGRP